MRAPNAGLVDIARDFLDAHRRLRVLFARHRSGDLRFEELGDLVGEDGGSVLFRLKERCHASFRSETGDPAQPIHREALFDLAVGSLFHEAMKFRENLYQREIYGPRVRALRSQAGEEEAAIFDEFERIQEGVAARLEEGLTETETLLGQTLDQLLQLLTAHRDDPRVSRFLITHSGEMEEAFGRPFDEIVGDLYGNAASAYEHAGRSLLSSGYYGAAIDALHAATERGGDAAALERLASYGRGMEAYLARDYAGTVAHLRDWAEASAAESPELTRLARDAVKRIGQLAEGDDRQRVASEATALLEQLSAD